MNRGEKLCNPTQPLNEFKCKDSSTCTVLLRELPLPWNQHLKLAVLPKGQSSLHHSQAQLPSPEARGLIWIKTDPSKQIEQLHISSLKLYQYTDQGIRPWPRFVCILRGSYWRAHSRQSCAISKSCAKLVNTDDLRGICILPGLIQFPKPRAVISKELKLQNQKHRDLRHH